MRAERVVGVVRALLHVAGRHDEAQAGERRRDRRAARRGERRLLAGGRKRLVALGPAAADELLEALGARRRRAIRVATGLLARPGARWSWCRCRSSSPCRPFSHRAGVRGQPAGESVATTGRWSLPAPSSSSITRNASTCQPGRREHVVDGAAEQLRQRRSARCRAPPAPRGDRGIRAPAEIAAVDAATGEVVDGRVEVAGHDHVLAGALLGEPVEVAAPVAQLPADRARPRARRRCGVRRRRPGRRRSTAACSCCRAGRARAPRPPRSRRGRG